MANLERERRRRGWSRDRLAGELTALMRPGDRRQPISPGQIGRWERGESHPRDYWLEKLCDLYEQTPEGLGLDQPLEDIQPPCIAQPLPSSPLPRDPLAQQRPITLETAALLMGHDESHGGISAGESSACESSACSQRHDDCRVLAPADRCSSQSASRHTPPPTADHVPFPWTYRDAPFCWLIAGALIALIAASILAFLPSLWNGQGSPPAPAGRASPQAPIPGIPIDGYPIAVQRRGNRSVLVTVDPSTGDAVQLLPALTNVLDIGAGVENAEPQSLIMPAYSPARHALAYIGVDANGTRSLWMTSLEVTSVGLPQVSSAGPASVLPDCGAYCNTLTWSPSGRWLIYEGPSGLMAIDPTTQQQRTVTSGFHDAWPACAPDGTWLVYQHAVNVLGYLVALPADDCLPIGSASAHAHLVGLAIVSWRPTWSHDGRYVAFVGESGGTRVFVVTRESFAGAPLDILQPAPQSVSMAGCAEPVSATSNESSAQNVLTYICSSPSMQLLMASSPESRANWRISLGMDGVPGPALYNPVWVVSAATGGA